MPTLQSTGMPRQAGACRLSQTLKFARLRPLFAFLSLTTIAVIPALASDGLAPAPTYRAQEIAGLSYRLPVSTAPASEFKITPARDTGLVRSIKASAAVGLVELGTAAAKEAIIDCQKGDYPGGGMGLLSLPFGAGGVIADHCRR